MIMVIWKGEKVRVVELQYGVAFNVERWGLCDNPRNYDTHYDWYCVKQYSRSNEERALSHAKGLEASLCQ